jgi:hypothetical protein
MEKSLAKDHLKKYAQPVVLCQFEGGKTPTEKSDKERIIARAGMYRRSLSEKCQTEIVEAIIERNYMPLVVAHENQFIPPKSERIFFPIRAILALIPNVKEVVCIDSFLMHGTALSKKKSIICWAGTNPDVLGYDFNVNLRRSVCETPECHRPNSYLFDVETSGYQWECPWNDKCTDYDSSEIVKAFDVITEGKKGDDPITGAIEHIAIGSNGSSGVRIAPQKAS